MLVIFFREFFKIIQDIGKKQKYPNKNLELNYIPYKNWNSFFC